MLTSTQIKLLARFMEIPFKEYSITTFKEYTQHNSTSRIQDLFLAFEKEEIIKYTGMESKHIMYKLNHDNPKTHNYMELAAKEVTSKDILKPIEWIINNVKKYEPYLCVNLMNNYSPDTQEEITTINLITRDITFTLKEKLDELQDKLNYELDFYYVTESEFIEQYTSPKRTKANDLVKQHFPMHNTNAFYALVNKAVKRKAFEENGKLERII